MAEGYGVRPRVCPKCGKPLEVRLTDVWPQGMAVSPMFQGIFGRFGGWLPVTCDCHERELVRRAVRAMIRNPMPTVACWLAPSAEAARRVAATWGSMAPPNFSAWVDERLPAACLASAATRKAIMGHEVVQTACPRISRDRPRERWAVLRDIGTIS